MNEFIFKNASERLLFSRLMESLPDHVYFKDMESRFIAINRSLANMLNLSDPSEAIGKTDFDFFSYELAKEKREDEKKIIQSRVGVYDKEEKNVTFNGDEHWVLTSKLPLLGEDGEIIGIFGISRDITEKRRAENNLKEQHKLLKTLVEILPCRVFVKDTELRFRLMNGEYRRSLGLRNENEYEGKRLSELVDDERVENLEKGDRKIIERGESILNREDFDASPVGDKKWMLMVKVPLRSETGSITGLVGMAADVTPLKDAQAAAAEAYRQLKLKNTEMESQLMLARDLQLELMASSMQRVWDALKSGIKRAPAIDFLYEPCSHLAGDFFQFYPVNDHSFGLLMCDVMGHGVKAALVTTLLRGLLSELEVEQMEPSDVLNQLNERLAVLMKNPAMPTFVTGICLHIDIDARRFSIASGGHPWPLFMAEIKSDDFAKDQCDPALGLISDTEFSTISRSFKKGDRLFIYTDGIVEATSPEGEEFGRNRLKEALAIKRVISPSDELPRLRKVLNKFTGKTTYDDDLCAILLCF